VRHPVFQSVLVYFQYFNSHSPVVAVGQYPVSGAYLNELTFVWCQMREQILLRGPPDEVLSLT